MNDKQEELFKRAAKLVRKEMQERELYHTTVKDKVTKHWKHWNGEQVETAYKDGLAKTFPMETFTHVETWVPRLVNLIAIIWPFFGIKAKKFPKGAPPQDVVKTMGNIKRMVLDDLDRMKFGKAYEDSMRSLCVEGSLLVQVPYNMDIHSYVEVEKQFVQQPMPQHPGAGHWPAIE